MERLFFAIPLSKEFKREINHFFSPQPFHGIRWTSEENMHITVHFLGATPEEEVPAILEKAGSLCESMTSFQLKLCTFRTIVKEMKPVMVWAQFEENKTFEDMCLLFRNEFPKEEKRKPVPHLTIARIKQLRRLPFDMPKETPLSFTVHEIDLIWSQLHSGGAKYELVKRWHLN